MLKIHRNGLTINAAGPLKFSEGSYNVPVILENDESYTDYHITMFVGFFVNGFKKSLRISINDEGQYIIPAHAFNQEGALAISFLLEKPDKSHGLMTNALRYYVDDTPFSPIETPAEPTWQEFVKQWIEEAVISIAVDKTLTKSGYAADSETTGNSINKLSLQIINETNTRESAIADLKATQTQIQPLFIESMEELEANGDISKVYILDDNFIYAYKEVAVDNTPKYTNQIAISTDADGNIVGLIKDHRYNSSDTLVELAGTDAIGFIPIKKGDVIRLENIIFRNETVNNVTPGSYYIRLYKNGHVLHTAISGATLNSYSGSSFAEIIIDKNGDLKSFVVGGDSTIAYMRMSFCSTDKEAIITVNEEIGDSNTNRGYTNLADITSSDWGENTRLKESGELVALEGRRTSNFVPYSKNNVAHVKGINILETTYPASTVVLYDSDKNYLGGISVSPNTGSNIIYVSDYDENVILTNPCVYLSDSKYDSVAYIRICGSPVGEASDCVITVNENIVESENTETRKKWTNTGRTFVPGVYDSQIAELTSATNKNTIEINKLNNDVTALSDDIKTLESNFKNIENGKFNTTLPIYWEEYLPDKIATIKALQEVGGKDCFSFPLLTDIHISINLGKRSGILAKRIMDECYMKYAVCCGDVVTRGANKTKAHMEQWYAQAEELLKPIRSQLLQTQGNHDGSYGAEDLDGDGDVEGTEYYCYNYTPQQNYEKIYRKVGLVGDVHFDKSGSGYWIDDVSNKVRYIGMNSHCNKYEKNNDGTVIYNNMRVFRLTQSQFDMTIEALTTIPSDEWVVVSFSHAPLNDRDGNLFADRIVMRDMLYAYKNKTSYNGTYGTSGDYDYVSVNVDFSSTKGEYVAHFSGHTHIDSVTTDFGIPIITTRCDGKEENEAELNAEKVLGTTSEQSFDVFTINKATRKIYATKIGAGSDREINY